MTIVRRKIAQGDLNFMMAAHERFIEGRSGGSRLTLKFIDLTGLDLCGRMLDDADFTGSSLENVQMIATRLDRAVLFCCDLRGADLSGAYMRRADIRGACLQGANLTLADLTQADFREGLLAVPHATKGLAEVKHEQRHGLADGARFAGATLDGSRFEGVSAFKADFTDCSMRGARLSRANFKDADLSGAMMEGADVSGANLSGARLVGADLSGVMIESARLDRTDMTGALRSATAAAIERAETLMEMALDANAWAQSGGVMGAPAMFDGEDLRPLAKRLSGLKLPALSAKRACMVGVNLRDMQMQGANLEGADLRGADLRGVDLRGARLGGALLNKADLTGAQLGPLPLGATRSMPTTLAGAQMRYARLVEADLAKACLDGADLTGADVTGADLNGATMLNALTDHVTGLLQATLAA